MTDRVDITDNMTLLEKLWPGAKMTIDELSEFRSQLSPLKQDIVNESIRLVYGSSDKRRPILSLIKAQYGRLVESRSYTPEPRYNATMTWHVSWRKTSKYGVPGAYYGCRCQTREEAEHLARENNGRVTCMDPKHDAYEYSEESMRADEAKARECLASLPRETIARHVDRLRSIGWLRHVTSVKDKLPGRVSDWPRMAVLEVYAEHLNQQERRR